MLVEDTKVLVQNAAASQEKLAQAAQSSVATITRLADVVKLGAASLGAEDPETQVATCHLPLFPPAQTTFSPVLPENYSCPFSHTGGADQRSKGCGQSPRRSHQCHEGSSWQSWGRPCCVAAQELCQGGGTGAA